VGDVKEKTPSEDIGEKGGKKGVAATRWGQRHFYEGGMIRGETLPPKKIII